jgi:hypothetical protein
MYILDWAVRCLNPCRRREISSSPKRSEQVWGPHSCLLKGYRCPFPGGGGGAKGRAREINQSPPSSADDKNQWNYTSSPLICLHGEDRKMLPLVMHISLSLTIIVGISQVILLKNLLEEHRKMNWKVRLRLDRSVSISNCQEKYTIAISFQANVPVFSSPLSPARPWQPSNLQPQVAEIKQWIY